MLYYPELEYDAEKDRAERQAGMLPLVRLLDDADRAVLDSLPADVREVRELERLWTRQK